MADPKIVKAYQQCMADPRANIQTYPMPEGSVGGIMCKNTKDESYIALPNGALLTLSQLLKECKDPVDRAQNAIHGPTNTPETCANTKINKFMSREFPATNHPTAKKRERH